MMMVQICACKRKTLLMCQTQGTIMPARVEYYQYQQTDAPKQKYSVNIEFIQKSGMTGDRLVKQTGVTFESNGMDW